MSVARRVTDRAHALGWRMDIPFPETEIQMARSVDEWATAHTPHDGEPRYPMELPLGSGLTFRYRGPGKGPHRVNQTYLPYLDGDLHVAAAITCWCHALDTAMTANVRTNPRWGMLYRDACDLLRETLGSTIITGDEEEDCSAPRELDPVRVAESILLMHRLPWGPENAKELLWAKDQPRTRPRKVYWSLRVTVFGLAYGGRLDYSPDDSEDIPLVLCAAPLVLFEGWAARPLRSLYGEAIWKADQISKWWRSKLPERMPVEQGRAAGKRAPTHDCYAPEELCWAAMNEDREAGFEELWASTWNKARARYEKGDRKIRAIAKHAHRTTRKDAPNELEALRRELRYRVQTAHGPAWSHAHPDSGLTDVS